MFRGKAGVSKVTVVCAVICSLNVVGLLSGGDLPLVPYPTSVRLMAGTSRDVPVSCVRDAALGSEAYRLSVTPDGIFIRSADSSGEQYARTTLGQLRRADGSCPCVEIEDAPKFSWRGVHLDEARHFFGKETVLRLLETMAQFKLNVLHWHLTDDQGWRVPIPGYHRLVETVRSMENGTNFRDSATVGSYGPYFYSRDDLVEIVTKAHGLHIRIVPEIEIPGHSKALLKAYPMLACSLSDLNVDNVVCVGKDATIRFYEKVIDEICEIFPDAVVHIGGDECDRTDWVRCSDCRDRMKHEGLTDGAALQSWVTAHFERYLAGKGRRLMGWDEIAEGGLPPQAMVMSWRGTSTGVAAAQNGHDVVMTPNEYCYFDYAQCLEDDPEKYPFNWTVLVPLAKVYDFDPLKDIPNAYHRHVLGAQANNWSEMTLDGRELEWKLWPRAAALSEVLWSYPKRRDFVAFARRLAPLHKKLRDGGVNAAYVWLHDDGRTRAGELIRTKTDRGETLLYRSGSVSATLRLDSGVLSLERSDAPVRVFEKEDGKPFFMLEVLDVGAGAKLVTARRKGSELVVTVLLDGERVLAKDRWDYRHDDDESGRKASAKMKPIRTVPHELDMLLECGHIQGATCSEHALYLSHQEGILKIDWNSGSLIRQVRVPPHLGDLSYADGRIYGACGIRKCKEGESPCQILVWDEELQLLDRRAFWHTGASAMGFARGFDGAVVLGDTLYVGIDHTGKGEWDCPPHRDCPIAMFTLDLRPKGEKVIDLGYDICYGVQTMATDGNELLFGTYGADRDKGDPNGPNFTRVMAEGLKPIGSGVFDCAEGFGRVPESIARRKKPVFFVVRALGGNIQGWRKDPTGNPPQLQIDFYEFSNGHWTDITERDAEIDDGGCKGKGRGRGGIMRPNERR